MAPKTNYITGIRNKIEAGDISGAESDLHHLIISKDFRKIWGRDDLPVIWGYISRMTLDTSVPTAMVDLRNGKVFINPQFILDKIHSLEDLLFIVLHERDHRLIRRIYRVDWYRLRKILDFNDEWAAKVRNVLEDAWINASVRSSMGIKAGLHVHQRMVVVAVGNDIQFHVPTAFRALADHDVLLHDITLPVEMFRN